MTKVEEFAREHNLTLPEARAALKAAPDTPADTSSLPLALARKIGAAPAAAAETGDELLPQTCLDWALRYAAQGMHLFPCESFVGIPLVPKWYCAATTKAGQIVELWSQHVRPAALHRGLRAPPVASPSHQRSNQTGTLLVAG